MESWLGATEIAAQHLAKKRNGIVASVKVDLRNEEFGDRSDGARACAAPERAVNVSSATLPGILGAAAAWAPYVRTGNPYHAYTCPWDRKAWLLCFRFWSGLLFLGDRRLIFPFPFMA